MGVASLPRVTRMANRLSGVTRTWWAKMPASMGPGCVTSSPGVKSLLMRYTRTALGLLNATKIFSDGISVLMWMGRVGNRTGAPCGVRAPLAGSMLNAVT